MKSHTFLWVWLVMFFCVTLQNYTILTVTRKIIEIVCGYVLLVTTIFLLAVYVTNHMLNYIRCYMQIS